jgi:hypothetical protein
MTIAMRDDLEQGIGLAISCWCGQHGRMSAEEALRRFDPDLTYTQVANRFTCTACGGRGHPQVQVRMCILDFYAACRANGIMVGGM